MPNWPFTKKFGTKPAGDGKGQTRRLTPESAAPVIAELLGRLAQAPDDVAILTDLGNAYGNLGDYRMALGYYRKALDRSAKDPDLHCFAAFAYQQMRQYKMALQEYQKALALKPTSTLYDVMGDVALLGRNKKQAGVYYQSALKLDPGNTHAHFNLAQLMMGQDRPKDAIAHLEAVIAVHPRSARAYSDMGVACGLAGDHEGAVANLKKALKLDPTSAVFHHNLGVALARQGKSREARPWLEKAVKLDPGNAHTRKLLAELN